MVISFRCGFCPIPSSAVRSDRTISAVMMLPLGWNSVKAARVLCASKATLTGVLTATRF